MSMKTRQFSKNTLSWVERLDVTVERPEIAGPSNTGGDEQAEREDDFAREISFQKQAQAAVLLALPKLHAMSVKTARPPDYFAENVKSDDQMKRVREKLLTMQQAKLRSETAKRLREQRKFATKIQKDVLAERQKDKRHLMDAVKKHRKGVKDQLAELLGDAKAERVAQQATSIGNKNKSKLSKKQTLKNKKYGHGGQKKRSKYNTAESSNDVDSFSRDINQARKGRNPGARALKNKKKNKRPGKSKRISGNHRK